MQDKANNNVQMEVTKDINRIKVVLVEKGSGYGVKMVYEYFAAGIGDFASDSQCTGSRCKGVAKLFSGR